MLRYWLFILAVLAGNSFAQSPFLYTEVQPYFPNENDSVRFIAIYNSVDAPVFNVYSTQHISNDTIYGYAVFCKDIHYQWQGYASDTIYIGHLAASTYTIHFTYDVSTIATACIPADSTQHFISNFTINALNGITMNNPGESVHIYPNPADQYFIIQPGNESGITLIELFNPEGQLVRTLGTSLYVATDNLPNGTYLLKYSVGQKNFYKKLIVIH